MMSWLRWLFTSRYKKALKQIETQYKNKGALWLETDNYVFRLDFENMTIEVPMKSEVEE